MLVIVEKYLSKTLIKSGQWWSKETMFVVGKRLSEVENNNRQNWSLLIIVNDHQKLPGDRCQKENTEGWPTVVVKKMVVRSWPLLVEYCYCQTLKKK